MIATSRYWFLTTIITVLVLLLLSLIPVPTAHTATNTLITVCPSGCDYTIIQNAVDAASNGDTILLASGTYIENVNVTHTVTIQGQGPSNTIVDGNATSGVFVIGSSAVVTLTDMTITNGSGTPYLGGDHTCGGGILNEGTVNIINTFILSNTAITGGGICSYVGIVNVTNSLLRNNAASGGGGIFIGSTLNITNSIVMSNTASGSTGGGIRTDGDAWVSVINSTVISNTVRGGTGGGIFSAGVLTLTNSTVNGNLALGGGGIGIFPGEVTTVINSTISGNTATDSYGGGIRNSTDGVLTLINSTVSNNLAGYGGGISNWNGTVILQNTILAGNMARTCPDCYGIMSSSGYNLVENASGCIFTPTADDITYIHPLLGPLQDNGGPTETHALLVGSPAFDAIPEGNCSDHRGTPITTDQRGIPRPQGAACDIGAYEAQTADLNLSKTVDQASPDVEETIVFTIQATNDGPLEATGVVISDTLPLGLTLTFSNTSQGAYTSGTGEWNVGSLPVGLSATLTITATVGTGTAGTTITNTATITAADQFDPGNNNIATAAVTVPGLAPAGQCIYLPLTMRKHIPPVTFPLHIGDSIPVHTVAYQGEIFYTKLVQIPDELSSSGRFYFSSQRDAVTEVLVDDKLVVLSGGAEVFAYNFSTSGHPEPTTIEVPRTTMEELAGQTVTIEYRDIYGVVVEASTMWLIWTP